MNSDNFGAGFFTDFIIGAVTGIILWAAIFNPIKTGYKQGQIHALTGHAKYELVINPDSTKTWEEIK